MTNMQGWPEFFYKVFVRVSLMPFKKKSPVSIEAAVLVAYHMKDLHINKGKIIVEQLKKAASRHLALCPFKFLLVICVCKMVVLVFKDWTDPFELRT